MTRHGTPTGWNTPPDYDVRYFYAASRAQRAAHLLADPYRSGCADPRATTTPAACT